MASTLSLPINEHSEYFFKGEAPLSGANINIEVAQVLADKLEIAIFGPVGRLVQKTYLPAEYGQALTHHMLLINFVLLRK
jgi:hypothetical protein